MLNDDEFAGLWTRLVHAMPELENLPYTKEERDIQNLKEMENTDDDTLVDRLN